jgi:hypothetical protein
MLSFTALPASYGDCLWIEYGDATSLHVILIDAGPTAPAALKGKLTALAERKGILELVVVTHVDADHIGGILGLLDEQFNGVPVRDLWFNGFRHLPGPEAFGERQGEKLTGLLLDKKVAWNVDFRNAAVMIQAGTFPTVTLPGGAKLTLLSPDARQLTRLRKKWIEVCGEADLYTNTVAATDYYGGEGGREAFGATQIDVAALADKAFEEDNAEANGSSIAFVLEFGGKRVLCGADAYPSRLRASLDAIYGGGPHQFDLVKVPHHGSENNVSRELIEALNCPRYLFSSSGAKFQHPSRAAVARVIKYGGKPQLIFNYRNDITSVWDEGLLMLQHAYTVLYGSEDGVTIQLD